MGRRAVVRTKGKVSKAKKEEVKTRIVRVLEKMKSRKCRKAREEECILKHRERRGLKGKW